MVDLSLCPFCGSKPETPFENLRDSGDMEDVVKVWTMHHHCRGIDMWIEGNDAEECGENWNRRSGVAQRALDPKGKMTKIAAECHRAKWQFDLNEDFRPSKSAARALILQAFHELHRIGDMAIKARDSYAVTSTECEEGK